MSSRASKPVWEDDTKVTRCPKCRTVFGWATRKHHCRACGKVFCNKCSTHTLTIPRYVRYYGNEPVRVCDTCFYKEKHELMKQKRDEGAKKFTGEPKKASFAPIIPPVSDSPAGAPPPQTAEDPASQNPSKASSSTGSKSSEKNSSSSYFSLPTSVRKDMMSKNVVNSIFDDDLFSSSPSQPTAETKAPSSTFSLFAAPDDKPVTPDAILGTTGGQKPLPVVKNKPSIPARPEQVAEDEEIPEPEPFPEALLASYDPLTAQTEQPGAAAPTAVTQPVKQVEPPKPQPTQPAVIIPPREEKPAPKPASIPPRQEAPVKATPAPAQVPAPKAEPARPAAAPSASISSLPSPFSSDFVMPPRDGGMGETPKARVMQEKLFFRYANAYLGQRGIAIDSFSDLQNGVNFIMLVEAVSHQPMPDTLTSKCKINPETRDDAYRNFHFACQFLSDIGKALPVLSIEKVLDGDISATLDLLWAIVFRFEVEPIRCDDQSGIGAVFSWTRQMIDGYPVEFYDFRQSFENGLIFNAIIHRFNPNLIDFSILFPHNKKQNLNFAFDTANGIWGIPKLLDADDTADEPDDVCVIIYLAFCCSYMR